MAIVTAGAKRVVSKLNVKAAASQRVGTVSKPFRLRPGKLVTTARNRDRGPQLASSWRGRSKSAVGIAFGAELRFPADRVQPGTQGRASFRARRC